MPWTPRLERASRPAVASTEIVTAGAVGQARANPNEPRNADDDPTAPIRPTVARHVARETPGDPAPASVSLGPRSGSLSGEKGNGRSLRRSAVQASAKRFATYVGSADTDRRAMLTKRECKLEVEEVQTCLSGKREQDRSPRDVVMWAH